MNKFKGSNLQVANNFTCCDSSRESIVSNLVSPQYLKVPGIEVLFRYSRLSRSDSKKSGEHNTMVQAGQRECNSRTDEKAFSTKGLLLVGKSRLRFWTPESTQKTAGSMDDHDESSAGHPM
ncbi:hypothetical protein B0A52_06561 [Exophiala mesophila]|uniref:Uncharacterized protein n=1 Tax=Exophiala mesophila TaxID=212818 RepID=A0A438N1D0_EXOME|nr:hypothetical protein B0A52_06561 [Exophiala mesophila]